MAEWIKRTPQELANTFVAVLAYPGTTLPPGVRDTLDSWEIDTRPTIIQSWAVVGFWDTFSDTSWPGGPEAHLQTLNPVYLCILGNRGRLICGDKQTPWGVRLAIPYLREVLGVDYLYDTEEE